MDRWLEGMETVVFQRAVSPLFVKWQNRCRQLGIRTVLEMDDDLWHVPRENPAAWYWRTGGAQRNLSAMAEKADAIVVSTVPLAGVVEQKTGRGATVCPNHVHPDCWGSEVWGKIEQHPNTHDGQRYPVIGWAGSGTHDHDFREALPALMRVLNERPTVQLRFLGCAPQSVKGVVPPSRFQFAKGVEFTQYPSTLRMAHFDIGIAPITDSKFNHSKSGIKAIEYASLSIPTIASNVGPYKAVIKPGETGLLCRNEEEWYEALIRLLDNPEEGARLAANANKHIWETYGPGCAETWRKPLGA